MAPTRICLASSSDDNALSEVIIARIRQMLQEKGLGLVRLHTLYTIEKCGSLFKAAPALGLGGVHAVRNRVRTLEENLNLILLVTDSTGSRITKAGRAVLELIRPYFDRNS